MYLIYLKGRCARRCLLRAAQAGKMEKKKKCCSHACLPGHRFPPMTWKNNADILSIQLCKLGADGSDLIIRYTTLSCRNRKHGGISLQLPAGQPLKKHAQTQAGLLRPLKGIKIYFLRVSETQVFCVKSNNYHTRLF